MWMIIGGKLALALLLTFGAASQEQAQDAAGEVNLGVFVLVIVIVSIVVATVMVIRQTRPGLPPGYDDDDVEDRLPDDER